MVALAAGNSMAEQPDCTPPFRPTLDPPLTAAPCRLPQPAATPCPTYHFAAASLVASVEGVATQAANTGTVGLYYVRASGEGVVTDSGLRTTVASAPTGRRSRLGFPN